MKLVEEAMELVESTLNTSTPDPFWILKAVVEEIFMSSPPAWVNPDRKVPDEFWTSIALAFCKAFVTASKVPALEEFLGACTRMAGWVVEATMSTVGTVGDLPTEDPWSMYRPEAAPVVTSVVVAMANMATGVEVLIPN